MEDVLQNLISCHFVVDLVYFNDRTNLTILRIDIKTFQSPWFWGNMYFLHGTDSLDKFSSMIFCVDGNLSAFKQKSNLTQLNSG